MMKISISQAFDGNFQKINYMVIIMIALYFTINIYTANLILAVVFTLFISIKRSYYNVFVREK